MEMSLEANIVEQLQELRKWQQQQQQELIRRQQEQRKKLTDEQIRVFETLSSSIDNANLDKEALKRLIQQQKIKKKKKNKKKDQQKESNLIDLDTSEDDDVEDNKRCAHLESQNCLLVNYPLELDNNENDVSKTPIVQLSVKDYNDNSQLNFNYSSSFSHSYASADLIPEEMRSFRSGSNSRKSILIDDVPVPSPKKDFSALLEEKLKDSDSVVKTEDKNKPVVKRPFLKKGQGLARFQPKQNKTSICEKVTSKKTSFSSSNQLSASKSLKSSNHDRLNVVTDKKKYDCPKKSVTMKNGSSMRQIFKKTISPLLPVVQTRFNLGNNVPKSQNRITDESFGSLGTRKIACVKNNSPEIVPDINNSDTEGKTKKELEEVRIFEFLEDKAENSSFCSTSSTVIAFLQQSTPLKQKALLHSATKKQISLDNTEDKTLEEIVTNTESNNLMTPVTEARSKSQNISQWEIIQKPKDNRKTDDRVILPYGTDIDMQYDKNFVHDENQDENVSLHVRFSEYNEYKTMSDTSSVSSESTYIHDCNNQGVWSDNSETPDTSDIESTPRQSEAISNCVDDDFNDSQNYASKKTVNSEYKSKEFKNTYNQDGNRESENGTEEDYEDDAESKNDTITSIDTVIENDDEKSLFKSELVRKRLLELEHEIEVFRKESATLITLKQKIQEDRLQLHEERIQMQRSLKEKETTLEAEKKRNENFLLDEKKRLAREKSALEVRMKEAYEKAQKSKQERQEIQTMRDQLEELKDEFEQKESKWSAMTARQRSQIRVLQTENVKLKQEIEQLRQKQKTRLKRAVSENTRAIHQIGKSLGGKMISFDKNDGHGNESKLKKACDIADVNYEKNCVTVVEEKSVDAKKIKVPKTIESIVRTRDLYENLLKDAIEGFRETQISERHLMPQMNDIQENEGKEEYINDENGCGGNHADDDNDDDDDDDYVGKDVDVDDDDVDDDGDNGNGNKDDGDEKNNFNKEGRNIDQIPVNYEILSNEVFAKNFEPQERVKLEKYKINSKNKMQYTNPIENKNEIKEIRYSDGRIEYWFPNGNVKKIFPDRGLTKMIYYNGDVRETNKDGVVKYFYAETRTWHTTMPDGFEVLEFPDGQVERKSKNGTIEITYADGSVRVVQMDGTEKCTTKDGTIIETTIDGDRIFILPNGQREIHSKDHKRREYPDGTVKLVYADGAQETRYANGRIRLKDKDGNLLMDTHQ